jgi:ABC-type branched-subunit amino acid transport system substrate-binding protein
MRKAVIPLAAFTASLLFAQSVDEFDGWMRTIDEKNQSVQRNIAAKDASAALADAQVLQETFRMVEGFWKQRGNAPDAVELSQKAQALAGEVVKAATAKDFDAASAQSIKIAETCTSCHRLYRPL